MTRATFVLTVISLSITGALLAGGARSQRLDQATVSADLKQTSLHAVLTELSRQTGFIFVYDEQVGNIRPVGLSVKKMRLDEALQLLAASQRLRFEQVGNSLAVTRRPPPPAPGRLSGKIFDNKGEALPGATLKIVETGQSRQAAVDGSFNFSLSPGTYTLEASFISYQTQRITGIVIREDKVSYLDIALKPGNNSLSEVTVTAGYRQASVAGLYARQKNEISMSDGISSEQIARTPDKNLGETLKRISGVNVVENKYVVVRGLGERYNGSMLNGQLLPSTELNRKQFSFDIIPSNLVDNVTVYKTITPDKSAEFGGGLVEVNTKTIPDENYFNVSIGGTVNSKTAGETFRAQRLGAASYFGSATSDRNLFGRNDWKSKADIDAFYEADKANANLLSNNWRLYNYTPAGSPNLQADLGRIINLKNHDRLGVIATLSYRNTWQISDVHMGKNGYSDASVDTSAHYGYTGKRYGFTNNLGGLAGIGYSSKSWKTSLQTVYIRTYDQQLQLGTGVRNDFGEAVGLFDLTTQTSMLQTQLRGEKIFSTGGPKLEWLAGYTVLDRRKPDNHQLDAKYVGNGGDDPNNADADFSISDSRSTLFGSPLRSWNRSFEKDLAWSADFTVPVKLQAAGIKTDNQVKLGYAGWRKDRLFWVYNVLSQGLSGGDLYSLSEAFDLSLRPSGSLVPSNFGDSFHKTAWLNAGYMMLDSRIGGHVRLTGGVRGEYYDLNSVNHNLDEFVRKQIEQNHDVTDYSDLYGKEPAMNWFPSAALAYGLTSKMNLRLSYAKSIIRPDLRELAYFNEYDFELGGAYQSSAPVRSTKISHYDFRYEWYPAAGEIVSVSLFYKKLDYPMEIYQVQDRVFELKNDLYAKNRGIEAELRKSFAFTGVPVVKNITLYGNFTRLWSKVVPMDVVYVTVGEIGNQKIFVSDQPGAEVKRPQAGASDYTWNASLLYDQKPFSLTVSYNYISNRLFRTGSGATLTTSLFETPLPSLDAQMAYKLLKDKVDIRFNMSNLLNRSSKVYQKLMQSDTSPYYKRGDLINYETLPGRTYGLSFNYKF